MLTLILGGCGLTEVVQTCTRENTAVADDAAELDLGFSVADLVARLDGLTLPMVDLAGEDHTVTFGVSRTAAQASLVDTTIEAEVVKQGGENQSITNDWTGACEDELTVPATVTLAEGDAVAVTAVGSLFTSDDGASGGGVLLEAEFDPSVSTFPSGGPAAPTAGHLRGTFLRGVDPTLAVWVEDDAGAAAAVLSTPGLF